MEFQGGKAIQSHTEHLWRWKDEGRSGENKWGRCLEVSVCCRINSSLFISFSSSFLPLALGVDKIPNTHAGKAQHRLQNPSDFPHSTSNPLHSLLSLVAPRGLSSHSTLQPCLRVILCEFIHLPRCSCWCHTRLFPMFPPSFMVSCFPDLCLLPNCLLLNFGFVLSNPLPPPPTHILFNLLSSTFHPLPCRFLVCHTF